MTVFFIIAFASYFLFLALLIIGWNKSSAKQATDAHALLISTIIPFRNEEKNLSALIESLSKIDYPTEKFEMILIDDHSTDNSLTVAKQLSSNYSNFKVVSAPSNGKKNTIACGVGVSKGEIIVATDADCEFPSEWLRSINYQFQNRSIRMVIGAVRIKTNSSFFSKLQAMEFCSLIGSAASTLALGFPTMCNGANLSYRKKAFLEVGGFEGNEHVASGDDEFLLRKIVKTFGAKSVTFLKDRNSVVTTGHQLSLKDLLSQRIRWAGKWQHNSDGITKLLAVCILAFQLSWLAAIGSLIFHSWSNTVAFLFIIKILLEGYFLHRVSGFLQQRFSFVAFISLQIFYPLYVIMVGILSTMLKVSWKDRFVN